MDGKACCAVLRKAIEVIDEPTSHLLILVMLCQGGGISPRESDLTPEEFETGKREMGILSGVLQQAMAQRN